MLFLVDPHERTGDWIVYHMAELTLRESEVLTLMRSGNVPKEIAHMLSISQNTVRNHVKSVHKKLGVHSRSELLTMVAPVPPLPRRALEPEVLEHMAAALRVAGWTVQPPTKPDFACSCPKRCRSREEMRLAHGTPDDFIAAVWRAHGEISTAEAHEAIAKYQREYSEAP